MTSRPKLELCSSDIEAETPRKKSDEEIAARLTQEEEERFKAMQEQEKKDAQLAAKLAAKVQHVVAMRLTLPYLGDCDRDPERLGREVPCQGEAREPGDAQVHAIAQPFRRRTAHAPDVRNQAHPLGEYTEQQVGPPLQRRLVLFQCCEALSQGEARLPQVRQDAEA